MRIAFLGTPEFAVPSLSALYDNGHILSVFTQPDKPVGRHGILTPPPVKVYASEHGIPVYQFERMKSPEACSALRDFQPDFMVTAAFGQMLSQENLDTPKYGCINVHGSLLPKYRGAAPIQWSIINGEQITGITTMFTDIGMDTGDILLKKETAIQPDETSAELYQRLSVIGADLLIETLNCFVNGTLVRTPQNPLEATTCKMLTKENGKIDFHKNAVEIHNLVRGVNPWPGAYAMLDNAPFKIWKTAVVSADAKDETPGKLFGSPKEGLFLQACSGTLELLEIQSSGGKRLSGKSFLLGKNIVGKVLE